MHRFWVLIVNDIRTIVIEIQILDHMVFSSSGTVRRGFSLRQLLLAA